MKSLRFGVVGLGHRGRAMYQLGATVSDGILPVAACDLQSELWTKPQKGTPAMAEQFPGVVFYEDFHRMLDEAELDVLLVETPANNHAVFCAEALRRGIHVLSDIPPVSSFAEAEMLWNTAEKSNAMMMVGANPNEWGFIEAMVDLHRQGFLGKPIYLEAEYIHDIRELWAETPWRRKSVPIRYCTHSLGPLLRLLPDEELSSVSCVSSGARIVGETGQHDLMTAHFTTPSNVIVRFTASFINEAKCGCHSYRVFGTEGYFERLSERGNYPARTMFNSKKLYGANRLTELPIDMPRHEFRNNSGGHGGADYALFQRFFSALRTNDRSRLISLKDGLRMSLPGIFAVESAAKGGQIVAIRYPWENSGK